MWVADIVTRMSAGDNIDVWIGDALKYSGTVSDLKSNTSSILMDEISKIMLNENRLQLIVRK